MTYQFAIFDFDGTLADTAASFMTACNAAARRYGFRELSVEEFQSLRTMGNREIITHLGVPMWKLPQIATFMRRAMVDEAASVCLFPGAADLLRRLKSAGIGIAIVSSNAEEGIRAALGTVAATVDLYECGATLFGKAQHFKRAIRYSGVDASRVLAIGDEARDIEAARKAGVAAGAVSWGYADPAFLQGLRPDRFFGQMDEIASAFGAR
ncbi:HAD hydrolase-like protein [Ensifer sp.]|jgi:phosphoglycolate phosphatase|uniref:HAD hydrolase-like protein n=1 Tax=Ensifer sp. TaxID=1872086 RepID=UPI002E0F3B4E|nr:HAD hydrolase-like protein [Ensifer sp.]